MLGVTLSRPNAGPRYKQIAGNVEKPTPLDRWSSAQPAQQHDEDVALTGEQDAAVAGAAQPFAPSVAAGCAAKARLLRRRVVSGPTPTRPHIHPTAHPEKLVALCFVFLRPLGPGSMGRQMAQGPMDAI